MTTKTKRKLSGMGEKIAVASAVLPKNLQEAVYEFVLFLQLRRDPDQAWFWTPEWQAKEREADEDIKAGRVYGPFKSGKDMMNHFETHRTEILADG